jgi:bifunctional non-homologous end joining protein LigD
MIFDLDPADNCTFKDVQKVAKILKEKLDDLAIASFCMLTGSRGAHIVIPLKRVHTFDETREYAHTIAMQLAAQFPTLITTTLHKSERKNHIFIDWLRNGFGSTGVAPYAVRAHENAPVAMPVTWDELLSPGMDSQHYTIKNALRRVNTVGDIWHSMNKHAISLKKKFKLLSP